MPDQYTATVICMSRNNTFVVALCNNLNNYKFWREHVHNSSIIMVNMEPDKILSEDCRPSRPDESHKALYYLSAVEIHHVAGLHGLFCKIPDMEKVHQQRKSSQNCHHYHYVHLVPGMVGIGWPVSEHSVSHPQGACMSEAWTFTTSQLAD